MKFELIKNYLNESPLFFDPNVDSKIFYITSISIVSNFPLKPVLYPIGHLAFFANNGKTHIQNILEEYYNMLPNMRVISVNHLETNEQCMTIKYRTNTGAGCMLQVYQDGTIYFTVSGKETLFNNPFVLYDYCFRNHIDCTNMIKNGNAYDVLKFNVNPYIAKFESINKLQYNK